MGIDDLVLHPISTGWWVIKAHICILFSLNTVNKSNVHSLRRFWFNLKVETRLEENIFPTIRVRLCKQMALYRKVTTNGTSLITCLYRPASPAEQRRTEARAAELIKLFV